ncbi:hypothetical protein MSAR_14830 [Mycolicibacterium sarraceniae]|uniref:Uncharacterized protein n=1 Tax=Mycolicibacterium sarraceniae TaxID=1534348 RepID=A0A7I7SMY8_9MYCO|nr:hypothetical protein MSAR_14830 [Mycolicibacterium sarraceniae]
MWAPLRRQRRFLLRPPDEDSRLIVPANLVANSTAGNTARPSGDGRSSVCAIGCCHQAGEKLLPELQPFRPRIPVQIDWACCLLVTMRFEGAPAVLPYRQAPHRIGRAHRVGCPDREDYLDPVAFQRERTPIKGAPRESRPVG